jgi:hypothetical protein
VAVQFEDVFAGKGVRGRKVEQQAGVDDAAVAGLEIASVAMARAGRLPLSAAAKSRSFAPETRMTPIPPRPGAVAMAAMVAAVFSGSGLGRWRLCRHLRSSA